MCICKKLKWHKVQTNEDIIPLNIPAKMCRTCQLGEIRFMTPIRVDELIQLSTDCPECDRLCIDIARIPSLIKNWRILTETSHKKELDKYLDYKFHIIV
jgi:hypothetical protein